MMGAHCLLAARRLDIPVDPALLASVNRGMGTLAGAPPEDYYGAYFYSAALSEADPEAYGAALAATHSTLVARQQTIDHDMGIWRADDQWGAVGGQVYSTSMAMLALEVPHARASALKEL